METRLF